LKLSHILAFFQTASIRKSKKYITSTTMLKMLTITAKMSG
jgi:hypothetical protein